MTYHEATWLLSILLLLARLSISSGDYDESSNSTLCDGSEAQNFTIVKTTDSMFKTLVHRDYDVSSNQITAFDHVSVQECVKNNCTQVCNELKCDPGQTAWYNKTWQCLDDSTLLKEQGKKNRETHTQSL